MTNWYGPAVNSRLDLPYWIRAGDRLILLFTTFPKALRLTLRPFIALKYLLTSSLTLGVNRTKPTILGTIIAKIMASENPMTDPKLEAEPITTKMQKRIL